MRSTSSEKKTTSFEEAKISSFLNGDMPLEKKTKHYGKSREALIPILSTTMDTKPIQTSQATEQECNKSQSMLSASISQKFLTPMVKMVDMGCYSKGDMSMRSLAAAYWLGSHHQTSAQQNHKSQERSVSFVKLQHHSSNHHFPC
ncbi:hypothetical protein O6H91_17G010900 [Diphasiastrum complanatum]|nr:hypothetical protein O6H91_17G010900 [Diphasiastrum complanatum]